jgi:hypothetical protein
MPYAFNPLSGQFDYYESAPAESDPLSLHLVNESRHVTGGTFNLTTTGTLGAGAITGTSLKATGLTSGRIPYVSTAGLLADSANITWDNASQVFNINSQVVTISAPTAPTGSVEYDSGYGYDTSIGSHMIRVYSYKTINGVKIYSSTYVESDWVNTDSTDMNRISWSWTAASGVDGYRVLKGYVNNEGNDYVMFFEFYKDITGTSFIDNSVADWTLGSTVTPSSYAPEPITVNSEALLHYLAGATWDGSKLTLPETQINFGTGGANENCLLKHENTYNYVYFTNPDTENNLFQIYLKHPYNDGIAFGLSTTTDYSMAFFAPSATTPCIWDVNLNGHANAIIRAPHDVDIQSYDSYVTISPNRRSTTNYTTTFTSTGIEAKTKISKYNNIATVSNGVPSEYATIDLTAQTTAKTATTIYTPTVSGMFRISIVLQVTTAATTSSVLGGATGVVITYTEPDGSVAQSTVALLSDQAGAVIVPATGNIGNTTATQSKGECIIYAKTGVAIQYAIGYTSVGATAMAYAAHLKLEAL